LGGLNLDNYIGDPSDRYRSNYKRLDELRHYYFQRYDNRDIYAYINLIKLYEKSMFEDIKKMLPARVKATTGLLIEPHILERSKIAQKKPTSDEYQQDVTIHYQDTTILSADNTQYESIVDANLSENIIGENNQYDSIVDANLSENLIADSYQYDSLINNNDTTITNAESYQQDVTIDAGLDEPTITTEIDLGIETYGQTAYETIGFGIYAQDGNAIRTYFDKDNRRVTERIRVQLITEEKERMVTKFAVTASANGLGDPRGGYISDIQTYTETKLNIQPFSGSIVPVIQGNIIAVKPVSGYLPTHYRNTSDLTKGLENSFFRGSKNTAATTLDGAPPVEIFVSNPNTLTVNRTGRNTSEPILEVE
jgi:predicted small secreted protein